MSAWHQWAVGRPTVARTRAQREVLLMSLSSSRKFVDDWIAERPQMVEEYELEDILGPPADEPAPDGREED